MPPIMEAAVAGVRDFPLERVQNCTQLPRILEDYEVVRAPSQERVLESFAGADRR